MYKERKELSSEVFKIFKDATEYLKNLNIKNQSPNLSEEDKILMVIDLFKVAQNNLDNLNLVTSNYITEIINILNIEKENITSSS